MQNIIEPYNFIRFCIIDRKILNYNILICLHEFSHIVYCKITHKILDDAMKKGNFTLTFN